MSDFLITYVDEAGLEHHGVLGQKWGVRQGPPYPLDASDHSSAEKKAGWTKSLDDYKKDLKKAKSNYNYAYMVADNKRHQAFSLSSKKREENRKRWDKAISEAGKVAKAKKEYKDAKEYMKTAQKIAKKTNKDSYKEAKKDYNDAFNDAYSHRLQAFSLSKKKRAAEGERWAKAYDMAEKLSEAKIDYKRNKKFIDNFSHIPLNELY